MNVELTRLKTKDSPDLGSFDWSDPFRLSDLLADHESMIKESAATFSKEALMPRVVEGFAGEEVCPEIFLEMGKMGLLGVTIDEQKEIIRIIVSKEQSNRIFEAMFLAGNLDTPLSLIHI